MTTKSASILTMSIFAIVLASGCKKKAPVPPPAPPPTPAAAPAPRAEAPSGGPVIAQFTAEPSSIDRGQSATLRWSVTGATSVSIEPNLGTVQSSDSRTVFPSSTTTYRLTATGPGGSANASATVNVNVPAPPARTGPPPTTSLVSALESVVDAYFDYDQSEIREDARNTLSRDSDALKKILQDFPSATIVVEGHCDERGSAEYNLGLGDRRAAAAKEFLIQLGVPAARLKTISYGKERPQCTESNEGCWQKNRRAHFAAGQ